MPLYTDRPGEPRARPRPRADRAAGRRRRLRRRPGPVPGQARCRAGSRARRSPSGSKERDAGHRADPQGAHRELETIRGRRPPPTASRSGSRSVHRPKETGEITYILEVEPRPRELQTENNRIERVVNVRKEKLKVLLVDSEPRYEYRYLKNYLEREETIDLNVVLLSSDPEYSEQDRSALPTFPAAKDELFAYDVVLVGDADPSFLSASQMQNLAEFVTEKGGGILFIAGENFNPLELPGDAAGDAPADRAGRGPQPDGRGQRDRLVPPRADRRGPIQPDLPVRRRRGGQRPDLAGPARAVLVPRGPPQEAGARWCWPSTRPSPAPTASCRSSSTSSSARASRCSTPFDDTWRWRFRVGDRYFGRFWIQTIRFLARSKLLGQQQAEVQTDRRRYQRGQPIQIRVRFPNPGLAPAGGEVVRPGRAEGARPAQADAQPASPGTRNVFEGALPQAAEGDYEVRLLPPPVLEGPIPTATFRVEAPAGELERIQMNEPELIRAADATGRQVLHARSTVGTLLEDLPRPEKVPLDTDPPIPLWNTWPVLSLFLSLITPEWVFRKRKQMV